MDLKTKLGELLIFLLVALSLVPPLFRETEYFDNVYYTILFVLLFYVSVITPYVFCQLKRIYRVICALMSSWLLSGVVVEILNFRIPLEILNSVGDDIFFTKCVLTLCVGLAIEITYQNLYRDGRASN